MADHQSDADGDGEAAESHTEPDGVSSSVGPVGRTGDTAGLTPKVKPRRKRRMWGFIAGGVAVLLVGGATAAVLAVRAYNEAAPVRAVEQFLAALADGNRDAAMEFVPAGVDTSLLTEEVLSASLELAPISDIEVTRDGSDIEASFSVGDDAVTRAFDVMWTGKRWVVADAVTPMPWLTEFRSLDVRVNGAAIPEGEAVVFPGTYEMTLESQYFALEGETLETAVSSADDDLFRETKVMLSEHGAAMFTQLVGPALQACLAMTSATTPCGVDIDMSQVKGTFTEGSVVRTLAADDQAVLGNLPYDVLREQTVQVGQSMTVDMDFKSEEPDGTWEYDWDGYHLWPLVDFSVEPLQVSWTG